MTRKQRAGEPLMSLIVPVYDEADAVPSFLATVERELADLRLQIVFVNDGSTDGTLAVLRRQAESDPRITVINLSRHFGKEPALTAGLDLATGDVVVPIDIDLQDPPALIHRFLEKWREGYDVVYGVREDRGSDALAKRHSAAWFYRLFNALSEVRIPENTGDFRLLDRSAVDALKRLPERVRFMKGLFAWIGFEATSVAYTRPARQAGTTKFNASRLWRLALDGLFSFSSMPLRIWSYIGATIATTALIYAAITVAKTLILGIDVPGYASLLTAILMLGGMQLMTLGIIGEYLGRIFLEVKGRPVYVIESVTNAPQPGSSAGG